MASDTPRIPERGMVTLPDEDWEQARRRSEIIGPLAALAVVGHQAADAPQHQHVENINDGIDLSQCFENFEDRRACSRTHDTADNQHGTHLEIDATPLHMRKNA